MKSKKTKESNTIESNKLSHEEMQIRKKCKIDLLICLIHAILIETYFIITNMVSTSIPMQSFDMYIKISYMIFIIIAVLMFEIAYKKGKKNFAIHGIELVLLAIHVLLIGKNIASTKKINQHTILSTSYIWIVYYYLKAALIYTKENRRKLKQISDIKEIVKEEKPTKKVAKKRKT